MKNISAWDFNFLEQSMETKASFDENHKGIELKQKYPYENILSL